MDFQQKEQYTIADLERIIALLRAPDGCPWDREQTHQSVRANFIEETYEAIEAIDTNNVELLKEELGDVLMQVLFHAQMEAELGTFTFADVVDGVAKKLIVRHPHVFGDVHVKDSAQVLSNWDEIKKKTKSQTTQTEVLESVSTALPSLMRSYKVQKKAAKVGVDIQNAEQALDDLIMCAHRLKKSLSQQETIGLSDEQVGDLLFASVHVARKCGVEPEFSLTKACNRFIIYFAVVEKYTQKKEICWSDLTHEELNAIWRQVATEKFSQIENEIY